MALELDGRLQPDIVAFAAQPLEYEVQRIDLCAAGGGHAYK